MEMKKMTFAPGWVQTIDPANEKQDLLTYINELEGVCPEGDPPIWTEPGSFYLIKSTTYGTLSMSWIDTYYVAFRTLENSNINYGASKGGTR